MKKSPDLSETLSKGANEAKEVLQQTAGLIENEWKRVKGTLEESETVPDGVKTAVARLGDAVDEMREFVASHGPQVVNSATRAARQAGVPIPDSWGATGEDESGEDESGDTAPDAAAETSADVTPPVSPDEVDDTVSDTVEEATEAPATSAADGEDDKGSDKTP